MADMCWEWYLAAQVQILKFHCGPPLLCRQNSVKRQSHQTWCFVFYEKFIYRYRILHLQYFATAAL
jgi:hypothetical protein